MTLPGKTTMYDDILKLGGSQNSASHKYFIQRDGNSPCCKRKQQPNQARA